MSEQVIRRRIVEILRGVVGKTSCDAEDEQLEFAQWDLDSMQVLFFVLEFEAAFKVVPETEVLTAENCMYRLVEMAMEAQT